MKLYPESEVEDILAKGGLLLKTVDCRKCGEVFVPHLVTDDGEPFGLCDEHYIEHLTTIVQNRAQRRGAAV